MIHWTVIVGLLCWGVSAFLVWSVCAAAGRADDMTREIEAREGREEESEC